MLTFASSTLPSSPIKEKAIEAPELHEEKDFLICSDNIRPAHVEVQRIIPLAQECFDRIALGRPTKAILRTKIVS